MRTCIIRLARMGKALYAAGWLGIVVFAALLLQGCDFFRAVAGRPTSEELVRMEELRNAEAALNTMKMLALRADSVERASRVRHWEEDSATVSQAMKSGKAVFKKIEELKTAPAVPPDSVFCLMMGYFNNKSNAERLYETIKKDGFDPMLVPFESGATGVAMFPCGSASGILDEIERVRGKEYFPSDFWIIWNTSRYNINNSNLK